MQSNLVSRHLQNTTKVQPLQALAGRAAVPHWETLKAKNSSQPHLTAKGNPNLLPDRRGVARLACQAVGEIC